MSTVSLCTFKIEQMEYCLAREDICTEFDSLETSMSCLLGTNLNVVLCFQDCFAAAKGPFVDSRRVSIPLHTDIGKGMESHFDRQCPLARRRGISLRAQSAMR